MTDAQVIDAAPAARPEAGRRRRAAGFAVTTAILSLFQAASAAPAPLYVVYQREWAFSPATLTLIFAVFVLALLALLALPRTAARRGRVARSLAPRIGVPRRLRGDVGALIPLIAASWALGGLYLSLGPSVVLHRFGIPSHFLGGLVVTVLCG